MKGKYCTPQGWDFVFVSIEQSRETRHAFFGFTGAVPLCVRVYAVGEYERWKKPFVRDVEAKRIEYCIERQRDGDETH